MKKSILKKLYSIGLAAGLICSFVPVFSQTGRQTKHSNLAPVTLTLGPTSQVKPIAPLFSGISMETEAVRPSADGSYYFSAKNTRLIALFKQLGVKHLRIGGNTVDDLTKTPSLADIDQLFAFAKLAGLKVGYSVRLKNGDPKESAKIATHIYQNYKDIITGITIGNETDQYYHNKQAAYLTDAKAHAEAMRKAVPNISLNGPAIHLEASWLLKYAETFKEQYQIDYIGAHAYFGGNAYGAVKPPVDRDPVPLQKEMLNWHHKYETFYNQFGPTLSKYKLPFRIDETNTYYMGGAPGASNSMAAAIWTLDYLYWWAEHGAAGINFHTGSTLPYVKGAIPNGATRKPGYYAVFWDQPNGGYNTQAVGYGIKAFDLGSKGKLFPVKVTSKDSAHVDAHAVLAADGSVYLTIINKEIGTANRIITLNQAKGMKFSKAESISLTVKDNNAGAVDGFTVGGAAIDNNGAWNGKWSKVPTNRKSISITLPATSAMVLHLSK